jgi:ubiquinol-cytochrome c reductase subunit 7
MSRKAVGLFERIKQWHVGQHRYRCLGLVADDLIPDESAVVNEAIRRLPRDVYFDRTFRFRRALNLAAENNELPPNEWTTDAEDVPYLQPYIEQVDAENTSRIVFQQMLEVPAELKNRNRV